jgi:hypothetical protein
VVFYALRELFARPESWWLGPVVQGPTIKPNNNRRVYTVAGHHEAQVMILYIYIYVESA